MKNTIRITAPKPLYKRLLYGIRNRHFKDRLFKRVFRDKKYLLELYNALNDSDYTNEHDLEVVTLEDVLFIHMKNDLSFIVGNTLNLYEHQSTVNKNIALRVFLYFAKQYEVIVNRQKRSIYGKSVINIPFPQCVVFYNGDEKIEDDSIVRMSDYFTVPYGKDKKEMIPAVECSVRVININYGHNKNLSDRCKRLNEYSRFIQIAKEYGEIEPDKNKAMSMAVDKAIGMGLLTDILLTEKSEVMSMLLTEFDEKKYKYTLMEEGREEGREQGIKEGREEGRKEGMRLAYIQMVKSNIVPASIAAENLNMTEEEFIKYMNADNDLPVRQKKWHLN